MADLAAWLLAQVAADEAAGRVASPAPWSYPGVDSISGGSLYDQTRIIGSLHYEQPDDHDGSVVRPLLVREADANGVHIARWDPARVLAECEAKRRVIEEAFDVAATIDGEWGCCHSADDIRAGNVRPDCYGPPAAERFLTPLALPYSDRPGYQEATT